MAKLVVTSPAGAESHHFVDKDRLTIGRDAACDIALAEDAAASKQHAVIVTVGLDHVLQDAGSRNGTSVNGKPIETHVLQNEDLIEIGESRIRYRNRRASLEADLERTMIYNTTLPGGAASRAGDAIGKSLAPAQASSAAVARAARTRFPLGAVRGLAGRHAGAELTLERPLATFGAREAGLAVIRRRPHGYVIAHVAGAARPRVNGTVVGAEPRALAPGDVIEIGAERLEFLRLG